jgi:hypothetical protein
VWRERPPPSTPEGLVDLLAQATDTRVRAGDIAWEPSEGAFTSFVFGRGVYFLGAPLSGGARDLHWARVRVAWSGQPLGVRHAVNLTRTPLAEDEGLLVAENTAVIASVYEGRVTAITASRRDTGYRWVAPAFEQQHWLLTPPPPAAALEFGRGVLTVRVEGRERPWTLLPEADAQLERVESPIPSGWSALRRPLATVRAWLRTEAPRTAALDVPGGRSPLAALVPAQGGAPPELHREVFGSGADETLFVDVDLQRLELLAVPGRAEPRATAGPPGNGTLPVESAQFGHIVAVFSGGALGEPGASASGAAPGYVSEGRVLSPLVTDRSSLVITRAGRVGFGAWPASGVPEAASVIQNVVPLVQRGRALTDGERTSSATRAALCSTAQGELRYGYSPALSLQSFAEALARAGCVEALGLASGPEAGFWLLDTVSSAPQARAAAGTMPAFPGFLPEFGGGQAARDFFVLRSRRPRLPDAVRLKWRPDATPSWMPPVFRTELSRGDLQIELVAFDPEQVEWRVRAGTLEPTRPNHAPKLLELQPTEASRVLFSLGVGHTTPAVRAGLAFGVAPSLPLSRQLGTLVLAPGRPPEVFAPEEGGELGENREAVQLPLLADRGELLPESHEAGELRAHGAIGVTPEGWVVLARGRDDTTASLARLLLDLGATRVVELDRGSHHPVVFERPGSAVAGPREVSVLHALRAPRQGKAFVLESRKP